MISTLTASRAWLLSNILLPTSILLFALGFFPYKPFIPGLATITDQQRHDAPARFDKVVFMVVDALRSDFVYSNESGFQFTQELIRTGAALPFTAHAGAPTITMPRVKAITTGSVPSFVDVILNFAESDTTSTLSHQDTWLAQIRASKENARLVMYGDDTWLKLFPETFDRYEGTTSFFVSDFVEVDANVTRHVRGEMDVSGVGEWDGMVLHYLGVDHIGHKAGPGSPHMLPKQREMDSIVEQIYTSILTHPHLSRTLFILCGDHGMNDGGNHGGSSPGETSPALVFMSPHLKSLYPLPPTSRYTSTTFSEGQYLPAPLPTPEDGSFQFYKTVEQSDIAPTIAGLLGLGIPLNSLGVFIPEFLPLWHDPRSQVAVLLRNARQLVNVVSTKFPHLKFTDDVAANCRRRVEGDRDEGEEEDEDAAALACLWSKAITATTTSATAAATANNHQEAITSLLTFSRAAQKVMSNVASNYNLSFLYIAILLAMTSTILALTSSLPMLISSMKKGQSGIWAGGYFFAVIVGYAGMMFASSYVEEEQQFWHWALSGWDVYLVVKWLQSPQPNHHSRTSAAFESLYIIFTLLGIPRIIRRWNQTGQKYTAEPDIVDFLATHPRLLWALIAWSYGGVLYRSVRAIGAAAEKDEADVRRKKVMLGVSVVAAVVVSFLFKVSFTRAQAPEMMPFDVEDVRGRWIWIWIEKISLVTQCRIAFFLMVAVIVIFNITTKANPDPRTTTTTTTTTLPLNILTLLLLTQSRAENIPLFALYHLQLTTLTTYFKLTPLETSITALIQQYTSFFSFGGSNSIASIDLSSAYNGVSRYDVFAVGLLTFIGNWAGPVWWVCTMRRLREGKQEGRQEGRGMWEKVCVQSVFVNAGVVGVMAACTALRTHLFIWSVFSPKYLYAMAWTVGQYFGGNVVLEGVMGVIGGG